MRVDEHVADKKIFTSADRADVVEGFVGIGEWEAVVTVERFPVAALVVEFARDGHVGREQRRRYRSADDHRRHRMLPLPAAQREQHDGTSISRWGGFENVATPISAAAT